MRCLLPVGGVVDHRFGILTNYNHKAVPLGIVEGMDWGGDVPIFSGMGFEPHKWIQWIYEMKPYRKTCLFMSCPDALGNAERTLVYYDYWRPYLNNWPVAFVAQDGMEGLDFPPPRKWDVLFVGGSTEWKLSAACEGVIARAQKLGKRIHIGRVNWWKRYEHFRALPGSDDFTCDGTRTRFDGTEKTITAWAEYMQKTYQGRMMLGGRR